MRATKTGNARTGASIRLALTVALAVAAALSVAGCGTSPEASPTATPVVVPTVSGTPPATPLSGTVSVYDLKYLLLDSNPGFFFCDPDFYPVPREDEMVLALQRFPSIQADQPEYGVILKHLGLEEGASSDEQKLAVYREHKKLAALPFEPAPGGYKFTLRISTDKAQGTTYEGVVSLQGVVRVTSTSSAFVTCPICLAQDTMIATPGGDVAVQDLRMGMAVWTVSAAGRRVAAAILRTGSTASAPGQTVIHVVLDDGRELYVSPGHPTADGRLIGGLMAGDTLDGAGIVTAEAVAYRGAATFDILPSGETGYYWADGVLIDSTLRP